MTELRCPSKLHAVVIAEDVIEVACTSRFCGYRKGVVVRHRINTKTGAVIDTLRFSDPVPAEEANQESEG